VDREFCTGKAQSCEFDGGCPARLVGRLPSFVSRGHESNVTDLSRNGAGFWLILREMVWKNRGFFAAGFRGVAITR